MPRKYITPEEAAALCASLRERAGISQSELARLLGTSRQHIFNAENPDAPSYHAIRRLIIEHFGGSYEEVIRVTLP